MVAPITGKLRRHFVRNLSASMVRDRWTPQMRDCRYVVYRGMRSWQIDGELIDERICDTSVGTVFGYAWWNLHLQRIKVRDDYYKKLEEQRAQGLLD
ncbi:hypothetical protein AAP_00882 [Ascosphaera apis ARSEF 7405]|uniref:Uncharacterized protein n=1 Tax=Ascosphaera apis ARSEF 7405 TaxID=392613 RepID=A0A168D0R8_9EURO|nr:hypothetical protein AAP_00882 [Ascosphaera apis ARSEF 7405]